MTVQPIGGEMVLWSDLDGTHGPAPAGGAALLRLLGAVTGRTLVAGPHDPALIDAIPASQITVLVRGVGDAEALATRYASRPGVTVCCGSLEKLAAVPAYDTVVAFDGLDRLCTPEAVDLSWDETLGQLLAVLRPQGRLLLGLENLFGLHRLLALPPSPADSQWVVADDHDESRPVDPAALHARLAEAGMPVVREYAAYPAPGAPQALLGAEVLNDPGLRGYLEATLSGLARPDAALLADPARLVTGALRHGLAASLAPAWILLAGNIAAGPAALVPTPSPATPPSPGPSSAGPSSAGPSSASPSSAGPSSAGPSSAGPPSAGPSSAAVDVRRGSEGRWVRGAGTAVPIGRTLEDLLLAACQRRALPAVRELLTAWQESPAAAVPPAQVVVDAKGGHHGLAPALTPVEALRRLAATLIGGDYAHLWPSPADEASLTALLAGMTGRELDPHQVPPGAPGLGAGTIRELAVARERLERELAEARARHEFYERTIANRDAELKRVRQMNALLSATVPGKAANTLVDGLKAGRRAVRKVVRRTHD
jgi:hypothetical protein